MDAFEDRLLSDQDQDQQFRVLVATPEKLSLVIRNKRVERPLSLIVMDEAHNMEHASRGLRIELLLAIIKRDCPQANFLLLMPHVENTGEIARWLAQDINAGQAISIGTSHWKPNERIIGLYRAVEDHSQTGGWRMEYETLTATPKAIAVEWDPPRRRSQAHQCPKKQSHQQQRRADRPRLTDRSHGNRDVERAEPAYPLPTVPKPCGPWRRDAPAVWAGWMQYQMTSGWCRTFCAPNSAPDFQLIKTLNCGVGVHHAGLSDEARALVEWLAESGSLRVLCAHPQSHRA